MGNDPVPQLENDPDAIADSLAAHGRVLLFGAPGVGKSTLASALGAALAARQQECLCLNADPGSPAFGPPGVVGLGHWAPGGWQLADFEPLCTLDAGRFRLPLVAAVGRLLDRAPAGVVLVDGPGVVRGVAGAELLQGLVRAAQVGHVLVLGAERQALPLADELLSLEVPVDFVHASPLAAGTGKRARARARTARWNDYLAQGETRRAELSAVRCLGTPPPRAQADAWVGRQLALLRADRVVGLGEVTALEGDAIQVRAVADVGDVDTLLIRDAKRDSEGLLRTAKAFGSRAVAFVPPPDTLHGEREDTSGPRPVARVGPVTAILVNGVFGDPLLHVRFRHQRRSLLFDLGDGARLPARIAHQVTDVFLSHAHVDHVAGFIWLLRSRIGETGTCRIFGPPGMAENIAGLVSGIHWDRIGARGPRFEIGELHDDRLRRYFIQAGLPGIRTLDSSVVEEGVLLKDAGFSVRALTLDHRTPVLAYSLEPMLDIKVRKERLVALGMTPGPWLTTLKTAIAAGQRELAIELPEGGARPAAELADDILLIQPGKKLVYATDLADTPDNRTRLGTLARHAHTVFCEATFCEADAEQAARTGHLTATACGQIAASAGVEHLVPFHFSRRYQEDPAQVYREVKAACAATVIPPDCGSHL